MGNFVTVTRLRLITTDETFRLIQRHQRLMKFASSSTARFVGLFFSLLATLVVSACSSTEGRHGAHGQHRSMPAFVLKASGQFFNAQLLATATLSNVPFRSGHPQRKPYEMDPRIMPHETGITSQRYGGDDDRRGGGSRSGEGGRNELGSTEPPVLLNLTLTNQGNTPLEISIREIDSELGNFVAQPDFATIPPGHSIDLEPMISRLGVISGKIPLTLEFRSGKTIESQKITLQRDPGVISEEDSRPSTHHAETN